MPHQSQLKSGERRSSKSDGRKGHGRGWSTSILIVGWSAALVAIVGIFLGGAGLFMIAAGHLLLTTWTLVAIGVASTLYLVWFLTVGPGNAPQPEPTSRPRAHTYGSTGEIRFATTPKVPSGCWACGAEEHHTNRVRPTGGIALCERCITAAVQNLSPDWVLRAGLASHDAEID